MGVSQRSNGAPIRNAAGEKRGRFYIACAFLLSIILIEIGLELARSQNGGTNPPSDQTPSFTLTTFNRETIRLDDLNGKIVVLNFWASWCGPCRAEALELEASWEHYRERGDVIFVGIAYADAESQSRAFIERYRLTYANGADTDLRISDQFQVRGVPMTFVLDQDLTMAEVIYAGVTREQLAGAIDKLLDKPEGW